MSRTVRPEMSDAIRQIIMRIALFYIDHTHNRSFEDAYTESNQYVNRACETYRLTNQIRDWLRNFNRDLYMVLDWED